MPARKKSPLIEQAVQEGQQSVTLRGSAKDVPAGEYLLELAIEDPWTTTAVSPPKWPSLNTLKVNIVALGDLRQSEVLTVSHVADEHGRYYRIGQGRYKIKILGKIVNRELPSGVQENVPVFDNEGWYVGEFELPGDTDVSTELAGANPVKLDYKASDDLITAIEDRCGDGAVCCRKCLRLFWSQETILAEKARGHPLFGPVEIFRIE